MIDIVGRAKKTDKRERKRERERKKGKAVAFRPKLVGRVEILSRSVRRRRRSIQPIFFSSSPSTYSLSLPFPWSYAFRYAYLSKISYISSISWPFSSQFKSSSLLPPSPSLSPQSVTLSFYWLRRCLIRPRPIPCPYGTETGQQRITLPKRPICH